MASGEVKLSAAMIVRDEEHHLEACLRSIQDLVDEIVLVDTGSEDQSVAIARRFGARVFEFAWCDDFAAARNHGLERCRGDWILYIDADERARPYPRTDLEPALSNPDNIGCSVLLHARSGYTPYREMRLFRNDPRIRFEGLMHETIWPGISRSLEEDGGEIGECGLVLDHVGYDGPQDHKHERNLPLLEKALAENPDHVYCWYHLGMVYFGLGRPEAAREAWRTGIEAVRKNRRRAGCSKRHGGFFRKSNSLSGWTVIIWFGMAGWRKPSSSSSDSSTSAKAAASTPTSATTIGSSRHRPMPRSRRVVFSLEGTAKAGVTSRSPNSSNRKISSTAPSAACANISGNRPADPG